MIRSPYYMVQEKKKRQLFTHWCGRTGIVFDGWSTTVKGRCPPSCSGLTCGRGSYRSRVKGRVYAGREKCVPLFSPGLLLASSLSSLAVGPLFLLPLATQATHLHFNLHPSLSSCQSLASGMNSRPCLLQVLSFRILKLFFSQEAWLFKIKCFGLKTATSAMNFKIAIETKDLDTLPFCTLARQSKTPSGWVRPLRALRHQDRRLWGNKEIFTFYFATSVLI